MLTSPPVHSCLLVYSQFDSSPHHSLSVKTLFLAPVSSVIVGSAKTKQPKIDSFPFVAV